VRPLNNHVRYTRIGKLDGIVIPSGRYQVGLSESMFEAARRIAIEAGLRPEFVESSIPCHEVVLEDIALSATPVSRADYSIFVRETGYITEAERDGWGWLLKGGRWSKREGVSWKNPFGDEECGVIKDESRLPVVQVSWHDAKSYCEWLARVEGCGVRLPGEAEWEVFARLSGVPSIISPAPHHPLVEPEDIVSAMATRLRDDAMYGIGLVWEWTEDWYEGYPGGSMMRDYGTVYKVLRGGSIASAPPQRTCEYRLRKCPTARSPYYGFRVAFQQ